MSNTSKPFRVLKDGSFLVPCGFCESSGQAPYIDTQPDEVRFNGPCPVCEGAGVNHFSGDKDAIIICASCQGSGRGLTDDGFFMGDQCEACGGKGVLSVRDLHIDKSKDVDAFWEHIHPLVVNVASARFAAGQFADAVEAALKEVNTLVKKRVKGATGQELDGAALMQRALSLDDPIILMSELDTDSGRDTQKGYMQIFAGAMTGIRNPKAHENITLDRQRAIHLLYLASLLMYKIFEFAPQNKRQRTQGRPTR